jgi:hypothetical protein
MEQSASAEANSRSARQEIPPAFYVIRMFTTVFTTARLIQSIISHPISLTYK